MIRKFVLGIVMALSLTAAPSRGGDFGDWFGAGFGTVTGFGMGHIFQGRYVYKGLMFTAIDGFGAILIGENALSCVAHSLTLSACNHDNLGYGLGILFVSRVWQVFDLFDYAKTNHSKQSLNVVPLPHQGYSVVWNYSF